MSEFDFDLFVIGGGSGGVRAARISAGYGARVAIAEEYRYGGTCVIRGCVPKKLMVYASEYAEAFHDAAGFGWTVGESSFDWATLIANKDKEIGRLEGIYRRLLANAGVTPLDGRATLVDAHTVAVGDKRYTAGTILIATGARPVMPDVPGAEHCISSNEAFHLAGMPGRVVVLGGGYIACEFAGIFNGLGAKTTQIYRGAQILRGFDDDLRDHLAAEMVKKGIDLKVNIGLVAIEKRADGLAVKLADGSEVVADVVMAATGRSPNTVDLGLAEAGVALVAGGAVKVDEWSRTTVPHIYAVGDVTNRLNLTPVAIREGHAFADTVFGNKPTMFTHENVASAVFSQPNLATVGLSEAAARLTYPAIDVYRTSFTPMKFTLAGRPEKTLMKLVVDAATGRVIGCHMIGPDAGEIIQGLAIAVKAGATKADFDATVGIHPTAAEEFVTMREKLPPPAAKAAE